MNNEVLLHEEFDYNENFTKLIDKDLIDFCDNMDQLTYVLDNLELSVLDVWETKENQFILLENNKKYMKYYVYWDADDNKVYILSNLKLTSKGSK